MPEGDCDGQLKCDNEENNIFCERFVAHEFRDLSFHRVSNCRTKFSPESSSHEMITGHDTSVNGLLTSGCAFRICILLDRCGSSVMSHRKS